MSIFKQIKKQSTGNATSPMQVFVTNEYVDVTYSQIAPFVFDIPTYGVTGGTSSYYIQNSNGIFTSLSNPFIRFQFTGNTFNLSGDTMIIHEIYKVKYETFKSFNTEFTHKSQDKIIEQNETFETEVIIENNVESTRSVRKTTQGTKDQANLQQVGFNPSAELGFQLEVPIHVFSASTSAITSLIYDFVPNAVIKPKNGEGVNIKSENLFDDRSQYFIKTYFRGSKNTLSGLAGQILLENFSTGLTFTITAETPSVQHFFTGVNSHVITASTFSGLTVGGLFFSFFDVPSKPKMEEPYVQGELTTMSPRFYFSNVNDGDQYVLDISYDLLDTGFTGTIFSSKIPKELVDGIQEFTSSLRTNINFMYRIGNVKILKNIFGVEQSVVTYSDNFTAKTQNGPASVFVFSTSDSPYIDDLPILNSPPNITYEAPTNTFVLSGTVSGSIVTGATLFVTYPNGNTGEYLTSTDGTYILTGLTQGTYALITMYRGYAIDSRNIAISATTIENYKLSLLWGNDNDTFGKMANENFFI